MASQCFTFEQLCIRQKRGFSCDTDALFRPHDPLTFDEMPVKVCSKAETSMLLLESHTGSLAKFSVIAFPYSEVAPIVKKGRGRQPLVKKQSSYLDSVKEIWDSLSADEWDGLQVLSVLTKDSLPNNNSRRYSLTQFASSLMDSVKAYFMFQRPEEAYVCSEMTAWESKDPQMVFVALIWTLDPIEEVPEPQVALPFKLADQTVHEEEVSEVSSEDTPSPPKRQRTTGPQLTVRSRVPVLRQPELSDEDDEVTFKSSASQRPHSTLLVPKEAFNRSIITTSKTTRRTKKMVVPVQEESEEEDMEVDVPAPRMAVSRRAKHEPIAAPQPEIDMNDITFGFETTSNPSNTTSSRKSLARKSLAGDWPQEEKDEILDFFDNLNPSMSEQTKIALTCKYVIVQFEKELTSKLLYIWVQKKGRVVNKKNHSFQLPEDEQKTVILSFFRSLNSAHSETTRTAFTIKYFQAQYKVKVASKQLLTWLNEKPAKTIKKATKRRR